MNGHRSTDKARAQRQARERANAMRAFMTFAGVYIALGLFFFLINLFAGISSPWFFWPMLPLTIPLVILAWRAFALIRFDEDWVERQVEKAVGSQAPAPKQARTEPANEMMALAAQAADLIDSMRRSARQIPKPAVRTQALDVCASADRVLAAMSDNPAEVMLARDFVNRYLTPANSILADYSRLAARNVASAEPTLQRVEEHDLPLLEQKLNEVHDRLHRGSLIDLQVAREMLSLDISDWGDDELDAGTDARLRRGTSPATGN
ncbi:MAG TPA: 2TM domain-containing protein [Thermomicrobiales bacterium]|nr:2TM domain-containing protein [Thermomicrobiales bacterium]